MHPALVFLDMQIPGLDSYEWVRQVKSQPRFHNTVVVLMSGRLIDKPKARVVGAAKYLAKPFTAQTILTTVQTYLSPTVQI
jgi:twitching motility two-component system response regulator PilG